MAYISLQDISHSFGGELIFDGISLQVEEGERIEISADDLPEGTTAVLITLETEEHPAEPSGPTVFYGDETHMVL